MVQWRAMKVEEMASTIWIIHRESMKSLSLFYDCRLFAIDFGIDHLSFVNYGK